MSTAAGDPAAPGAGRRGRPRGYRLIGWLVGGLMLAGALLIVDPGEVVRVLGELSPAELIVLLLLASADRLLMGLKWGLLLRLLDIPVSIGRAVRLFYQGSFAGVLMPAHVGGDVLRAYWVSEREPGSGHRAVASLVMERLLGLVSAANWAVLGGVLVATVLAPSDGWAWVGLGLLAALLGNALVLLSLTERTHDRIRRLLERRLGSWRLGRTLHKFYEAYAGYRRRPRGVALVFLLTLIEQGVQIALLYLIAAALDVPASPLTFGAAAALQLLIARLPVAPDGLGLSEVTAVGAFGLIGMTAVNAVSVSLVGHVLPLLALTPGGLMLLARGGGRLLTTTPAAGDARG